MYILTTLSSLNLSNKILIWDNDGTIMGSRNPNDQTKIILPNIEKVMNLSLLNCVVSGFKSLSSESKNFPPNLVINRFKLLMEKLPIKVCVFSPKIGGSECYVLLKIGDRIKIIEAHRDSRYKYFIKRFKKPDIGMLVVLRDIIEENFRYFISNHNAILIGDAWYDKEVAKRFSLPFLDAKLIHML